MSLEKEVDHQLEHTPGYVDYILSALRNFPIGTMKETFMDIGQHPRRRTPVLIVWGDSDVVVPTKNRSTHRH